ncbi:MAG: M18 family aminopeptidase [Bacillales bacterium]|nr:M18 family aminopeptidase [Bacillales bacterium]
MKQQQTLGHFIKISPTIYQTISNIKEAGIEKGLEELKTFEKGKSYYTVQQDNTIALIRIPQEINELTKISLVATHGDSPTFKLKPQHQINDTNFVRLGVEPYGGLLLSSWLDRPLGIAGIVYYQKDNNKLERKIVDLAETTVVIPNVAMHIRKEDNHNYKQDVDFVPILASKDLKVLDLIREKYKLPEILSFDLMLYNQEDAINWGNKKEYISSARLDDMQNVYAGAKAFLESEVSHNIQIFVCFDKEEIGSRGIEGADSQFLTNIIKQIKRDLKITDFNKLLNKSLAISADNAHAFHPAHAELYDNENRTFMNKGIVIKTHAGLAYQTNAYSSATIKMLAKNNKIPYQEFSNKPGVSGGGTLGVYLTGHINMPTIDIGLAQLAMHSTYETAGNLDTEYMYQLLKAFYKD